MIIGTAGHIDHGKTTLVRALTGVDTDRLKEEKARGISIELGYAYLPVPGDAGAGDGEAAGPARVLGFIDVPGHERFVHTMAAGASGIDHVLLVVAADDGVMPQTREHLAIALLFGITQCTVVLTKTDRADAARIATVRADIAALVAGSPLRDAPVFETAIAPPPAVSHLPSRASPEKGAGTPDAPGTAALRTHLFTLAGRWHTRRSDGLFRLAVDRVFTLAGHGTIVTGTVYGGQVHVGDMLTHAPSGRPVRVRSLHAQNRVAETGGAGQRVALNITGVDRQDIGRGDWIADARVLQSTTRLDARVRLLAPVAADAAGGGLPVLAAWTPLHVHMGAAHLQVHAVPLQGDTVAPGAEARVQLVFETPVQVVPGDRLILRNAQGTRTVGGGTVLDPQAPERRRRSAERMQWLDAMETLVATGDAHPLLAAAPAGLTRSALTRLLGRLPAVGWAGPEAPGFALGAAASSAGAAGATAAEGDTLWLAPAAWARVRERIVGALERHHASAPDEPGLNSARLQRMSFPGRAPLAAGSVHGIVGPVWQAWIDTLLAEGALTRSGHWLHLPGHQCTLSDAEGALATQLQHLLQAGGNDPPWVRDLARDVGAREDMVRELLRKLARSGALYQVVKDLFYPAERMAALARAVAALGAEAQAGHMPGAIEARAFRDAVQLGRKRAIQILEFFDRIGYTRRVGDLHLVRPNMAWTDEGPASGGVRG